ncbi:MAG: MFS transporter [Brasilonema octagenarum HA4186-MV1]|jgi:MFS family permease|uniref:MFS transporter n=2 Tax=Brasilonema TaxID=383614 RepID=A0A856MEK4_9CYAN|nr:MULTISPECIES: MFS transporter [Brasilonema]MBW4627933.1 MFS transporter [Brasilonema octagenarum HA4186-MV1]NMF62872.1 MFS transporter [Brasilonema octagenarum UFV-OR1]QDL08720.1 MFS transporter [Brasilonema sennae CENA114]QDL15076.1 MFS transporter [Brasilonema octagenarum UFV-E1]
MTSSLSRIDSNAKSIQIDANLLLIVSISLVAISGVVGINPIMPNIAKSLNIPTQEVGLIMTTFLMPTTVGTLIFGALADRIGRKKVLIPSLLLFGVGGILCAIANNFHSLLEWRFLTGVGAASLESLELTLISDLYSGKMLTTAMGFNSAMIGVAATIYPLIGGVLGELSWRYPFLLSILAFPVALLISKNLKVPTKQKSTGNLNFSNYIKNTFNNIKNPQVFALLFAVFSLFVIELGTFYTYVPILAGTQLGASGVEIGIIICCQSLVFSFVASQVGFLANQFSEKKLIMLGFLLCGLSLLIMPAINNAWLLIIPSVIFGVSVALIFPPLQATLAGIAPEGYRAGFMALNVTVQSLGRALGPLFAGLAYGAWGIQGVFYASVVLIIITVVVFGLLHTSKKLRVVNG